MNILAFPINQIRDDNYAKSEVIRISSKIRQKESDIATLAHEIWLLRLEREGHEEVLRGQPA